MFENSIVSIHFNPYLPTIAIIILFIFLTFLLYHNYKLRKKLTKIKSNILGNPEEIGDIKSYIVNSFDYLPIGIVIMDRKGRFFYANSTFLKIVDRKEKDFLGKKVFEVNPPIFSDETIDDLKERIKQRLINGVPALNREIELINKNKERVPISYSAGVIKDIENTIIGEIVIIIDIRERKKAEEALRYERDFNENLLKTSPAFVVIIDAKGKVVLMNNSMLNALDYSFEEVIGKDYIKTFVPEKDREDLSNVFNKLIDTNQKTINENYIIAKNGNELLVEWHGSQIYDKNNNFEFFYGVGIDITERKKDEQERERLIERLEQLIQKEKTLREETENAYLIAQSAIEQMEATYSQLENSNYKLEKALIDAEEAIRLKTEFLAIMSHELRTPLTGMLGFSDLLLKDETLSEEQKENASYISSSGKRLLNVLSDLLEISVLEAGKFKVEISEFNIDELIQDIFILLKDSFKKKGIKFKKFINSDVMVVSDQSRIRQVLLNLVGNAIKFTENGEITVEFNKKDGNYVFNVKDTGIGISKEDKDKIFDMFVQTESAFKRKYQGTGLGLAICKKLIEILEGSISLESEPEKGSNFCFSVPILTKEKIGLTEKKIYEINESEEKKRDILFAEDEESNFSLIQKMLLKKKVNCKGFYNGLDLVNEFKKNKHYDLIILDIQMPIMNGIETFYEIRKIDKHIPVIALTAFASMEEEKKYLDIGFNDYIIKPIDFNKLYKAIVKD